MKLADLNKNCTLKRGVTTGTCAAAASVAAYLLLSKKIYSEWVTIRLQSGLELELPVENLAETASSVSATLVKDAGDDPDTTDKIKISVSLRYASANELDGKDYLENSGTSFIIIRGGPGVGICGKPGLDVAMGKYAVNPAPRKLIVENLNAAGFSGEKDKCLLLEISAEDGENKAKKTLNPTLGITGGISILGISGIVEPYSNAAYIHSIKLHMRSIAAQGLNEVAISTGTRTQQAFYRDNPAFPACACVRIGDFIADSLRAAAETGLLEISVACMPGKLYKYACGYEYTHAHNVKLNPALMAEILEAKGYDKTLIERISTTDTVGEAASFLNAKSYMELMNKLADDALLNLQSWAANAHVNIFLYDSNGSLLLSKISQKKEKHP